MKSPDIADVVHEDMVDLLVYQHAQIRDLFAEVEASAGSERQDAFERLVRLLAVHETAEEEIVHPMARQSLDGGEEIVADRLSEEHAAKALLAELEDMDTADPNFMEKLDKLRIAVLTHARFEERYEFDCLRGQFSDAQNKVLVAAVRAAQAAAPTHPHPGTESAKKNIALGPVMAIVDRTRDLIKKAMNK